MGVWIGGPRTGGTDRGVIAPGVLSFVSKHGASDAFKTLFKEGMGLVETAATYLDGPGRLKSKTLPRHAALAYATESMRLTTRLMQIASWLLLRRAVVEGELTPQQALSEKHRVRLTRQEISCDRDTYAQLPNEFVDLCDKSLRLQERVIHLDQSIQAARGMMEREAPRPVEAHWARLRAAFPSGAETPFRR
jgi:regulator of CtrA degradation